MTLYLRTGLVEAGEERRRLGPRVEQDDVAHNLRLQAPVQGLQGVEQLSIQTTYYVSESKST